MRGGRGCDASVLTVLALAAMFGFSAGRAGAQFVQYTPPGDFVSPAESQDARLDQAMQQARWRFGRMLANPWISLRDVSYQDNLTSSEQEEQVSDLTAGVGAGINTYLPLGGDVVWSTFLLPEYVWWRDREERRRLNGRYGTGLFGNFGRIGVEAAVSRFEESKTFSREVEERVNQGRDEGSLSLTLDLGKGVLLFARGSVRRFESLEKEPGLEVLSTLDREVRIGTAGIGFDLGRGLKLGVGYEESEAEFESTGANRSNAGSSIVLDFQFDGELFDLNGSLADRSVEPEPGSSFVEFDGRTGSVNLAWRAFGPVRIEFFGGRDLSYSLQSDVSYFEDERAGVSLSSSLGSTGALRFFFEQGESVFVEIEPSSAQRIDDRDSWGASLTLRRGQISVTIGATRTEYDSNVPEFDREFTRVSTSITLGTSRLSPWG